MEEKLAAIAKSIEEKMFIVMYFNENTEANEFEVFSGRTEAYNGIHRIIMSYDIDPKDILVLVEYIVLNREDPEEPHWALMHPDRAKNAYQFCKSVADKIPEEDRFDVDEYTDDREGEENSIEFIGGKSDNDELNERIRLKEQNDRIANILQNARDTVDFNESDIGGSDYMSMLIDRARTNLFEAPPEDAFANSMPDHNPFV